MFSKIPIENFLKFHIASTSSSRPLLTDHHNYTLDASNNCMIFGCGDVDECAKHIIAACQILCGGP
jgi:hypothetical protein